MASHPASLPHEQLLSECTFRAMRRSGPGGQHRNKVETAVILEHRPTGLRAEANERRSQADNRKMALTRLRLNLALAVRTAPGDAPSPLWRSRCVGRRVTIRPTHDAFPALLAEALDVLAFHQHDPKPAAAALDCSVSQLVKLLAKEPRALAQVNRERAARGLHRLR